MNALTKGYLVIMGIISFLILMSLAVYYVTGKPIFMLGLIIFQSFIGGVSTGLWVAKEEFL